MCVYVTHMAVGYNIVSNNEKLGAECLLIEVWKNTAFSYNGILSSKKIHMY